MRISNGHYTIILHAMCIYNWYGSPTSAPQQIIKQLNESMYILNWMFLWPVYTIIIFRTLVHTRLSCGFQTLQTISFSFVNDILYIVNDIHHYLFWTRRCQIWPSVSISDGYWVYCSLFYNYVLISHLCITHVTIIK